MQSIRRVVLISDYSGPLQQLYLFPLSACVGNTLGVQTDPPTLPARVLQVERHGLNAFTQYLIRLAMEVVALGHYFEACVTGTCTHLLEHNRAGAQA